MQRQRQPVQRHRGFLAGPGGRRHRQVHLRPGFLETGIVGLHGKPGGDFPGAGLGRGLRPVQRNGAFDINATNGVRQPNLRPHGAVQLQTFERQRSFQVAKGFHLGPGMDFGGLEGVGLRGSVRHRHPERGLRRPHVPRVQRLHPAQGSFQIQFRNMKFSVAGHLRGERQTQVQVLHRQSRLAHPGGDALQTCLRERFQPRRLKLFIQPAFDGFPDTAPAFHLH